MDYTESQNYLNSIKKNTRIKFGLGVVSRVLDQDFFHQIEKIKIIQVGGTNGKGSTSYFLASILQKQGYKTGLFISPHLLNIRERISVDSHWISEKEFATACFFLKNISKEFYSNGQIDRIPTYFEYLFLISIYHFIIKKVDYIILEVGMGGRFDATTSVKPEITVITSISLDHEKFLGSDIRNIALEKAGIIKAGIPVISYNDSGSVAGRVILKQAQDRKAPLYQVFDTRRNLKKISASSFEYISDSEYQYQLKNPGTHFAKNAACAIRCLEILKQNEKIEISNEIISKGLEGVLIPGRIETFFLPGRPQIIIDVGHNPDSVRVLSETLRERNIRDMVLVYGVLKQKEFKKMLNKLLEFVKIIIVTEPDSELACAGDLICDYLEGSSKTVIYVKESVNAFKKALTFNREIVITGSFYLAGPVRKFLINEVNL